MLFILDIPEGFIESLVAAAKDAGLTEEDFVKVAIAEKLARLEHQVWLNEHYSDQQQSRE